MLIYYHKTANFSRLETSSLKSLLEQNNTNISYYSAAAMPESDYANLLNEIEQNKDSLVEQIQEKVTSFYDLLKILTDLDLEEKDLNKIFATLEIIEIMALKNGIMIMIKAHIFLNA